MLNNARRSNNDMAMGYVRVIHTVPDGPNVDVYANDELIVSDLAYGDYTDYLPIPEGRYRISLYVAGAETPAVLSNMLTVNPGSIMTVAAIGTLNDIGMLAITDTDNTSNTREASLRFLHLSPNAPAVDITLPNGTVVFANVAFKEITPYIDVPPMDYTLQVRVAGTSDVVLTVPNVNPMAGNYYTVYAIGLVGGDPALDALLIQDGDINIQ